MQKAILARRKQSFWDNFVPGRLFRITEYQKNNKEVHALLSGTQRRVLPDLPVLLKRVHQELDDPGVT